MTPGASSRRQDKGRGSASHGKTAQKEGAVFSDAEVQGFVAIARVVRPQGRKGEVLAEILTDFPSRFAELRRAFLDDSPHEPRAVVVEHTWLHKGKVVLKFANVGSIDDAETLRGRYVFVPEEEKFDLPADQYYVSELIGCEVVADYEGTRKTLGRITEVEPTGGVDLLHVSDGSRDILIPFAQAICKTIDPAARLIVIHPPDDLLDLNRE